MLILFKLYCPHILEIFLQPTGVKIKACSMACFLLLQEKVSLIPLPLKHAFACSQEAGI